MKIKRFCFIFLIIVFVTSSCAKGSVTEFRLTSEPTGTRLPQTRLTTQTNSPTLVHSEDNNIPCIQLSTSAITEQGYLILENSDQNTKNSVVDLSTMIFKSFSSNYKNIIASPNGNSIAYLDLKNEHWVLSVINAQGTVKPQIDQNVTFMEWVNDHTLAIKDNYESNSYTFVLDIPTGKIANIATNFPDLRNDPALSNIWARNIVTFDPLMQYATYPTMGGIGLRRLSENSVIKIIETSPYRYYPVWSPAGESFILPLLKDGELSRVFTDGKIEPLTNFAQKYSNFVIHSYGWSPDGKKIAFWVEVNSNGGDKASYLTIMTLGDNSKMIMTCLKSHHFTSAASNIPIWSPDSKKLAVQIYSTDENSLIYIVDPVNLYFSVLAKTENSIPFGWLSFPILP